MRVGLFGGTFNPVHLGHLLLAEGAREALQLDQVLWIPTRVAPHRTVVGDVSSEQRASMVQLAIQDHPSFRFSRMELDRPAPSYTIDTVRQLQREGVLPAGTPCRDGFFLLGSDIAQELSTWKEIDQLLNLIQFAVILRPGHPVGALKAGVKQIQVQTVDISASEIRKRIHEGHSIRYLVPEPVRQYIQEHGLYQ